MASLLKNTAIYGLGNMAQKGLSFLLVFMFTHYLTPSDIGIINTLQVFSVIYVFFLSFGLERSLYRLYHDYKDVQDRRNFLGTINIGIVIISTIVISITFLLKDAISALLPGVAFYPLIILGMCDAFFTTITIVPKILFQVEGKPFKFLFLTLGQAVFGVTCTCVALYMGYRSAAAVFGAGILSYIFFFPFDLTAIIKNVNFKFDTKVFTTTLKYSLPMLPSLLSSWVINMSDRFFINHFYNLTQVGLYSVVYKIGQVVQLFSTAVLMSYNPIFFEMANKPNPDHEKIQKLHNDNILLQLFMCFIVAFISNDFIKISLTESYLKVAYIVPIVAFGYFFIQMNGLQNLSFHQSKKIIALMFISVFAAVTNIILNYFLIKYYGIDGAAYSTVITQLIYFAIIYKISLRYYVLRINFKIIALYYVGMAALVFIFFKYVSPGWLGLTLKLAIIVIIFYLMFYKQVIGLVTKFKERKQVSAL
ncbi:lipopolysaccharide biosynthesis protein [Mucilaginibacter ginsenosidivorax]|uniref:Oligosaccharide flippase family protein n=1 Tax=Mucilaginibacter ginsenosidivorax TaxID=862126 RepID=A0A5B8W3V2_9SPHI|nr:oligosaccharide flippase family protein [Mucilaginibacter ginsenosidivorax]QEC78077.1 oligosaccharide flippase family protein [Mucilaginibacter ginsenosidivorax]